MNIPFYIGGIKTTKPSGDVSLGYFIKSHVEPKDRLVNLIDQIYDATKKGDKKTKTELKEKLPFFTVTARFDKRRKYSNIIEFNPIAQLDFDGLTEIEADEFKSWIFENYPQIICTYLSPSKKGVKALIKIPKIDIAQGIESAVKEYKDYYRAIESEFGNYKGFDSAPKNLALPLYLSYDFFLLNRPFEETETWSIKEEEKPDLTQEFPLPRRPYKKLKSNNKNEQRAYNTVRKAINNIVTSPGHYQLRSACLIFGTRCGAGYVDYNDAKREVEELVRANGYLRKGVDGYIKTALWGLGEGYKTPRYY